VALRAGGVTGAGAAARRGAAAVTLRRGLATALLAWWDRRRLSLPWRSGRTPYSVWVSEVMLQQTVLKAVVPHFERWMRVYPDLASLSAASEREVTRLWEGLGYYSRARNLLAAARALARRGGEIPSTYAELRSLPGVGDYTARAILSLAYGLRFAVVDANVRRVAQRLLARAEAPGDAELQRALEAIMPRGRAGDLNEALMELGQRVCVRARPLCGSCPVVRSCLARARGLEGRIPGRGRARAAARESVALILLRGGSVRLCRHDEGLFRGLWTFPRLPRPEAEALAGRAAAGMRPLGELRARTHTYTRHRERLLPRVYGVKALPPGAPFAPDAGAWVSLAAIERRPMPSAHRRIADELRDRIGELRRPYPRELTTRER
jgi:A/G-specific adenine glycosylase